MDRDTARDIMGVFFDIDDTFTTDGKIPKVAFDALWALKTNGLRAVPVTGRPAGWCDHISRMWPVDAVIGENGAFYFWYDEREHKLKERFLDSEDVRREKRLRLERIKEEILKSVPGTAVASGERYREADLAIDYCEDVPPLDQRAIDRICWIFRKHGATSKVSSVHVNGWFGNYDKLKMTQIFAREQWGLELDANKERLIFCGDSPNDEPMFQYFPYSAGVQNILRFADQITHWPAFISNRAGGEGFAEIVEVILERRGKVKEDAEG
ncbi:MAG: HAD-IIB family hydrolase [Pseudomonadota bacterium]